MSEIDEEVKIGAEQLEQVIKEAIENDGKQTKKAQRDIALCEFMVVAVQPLYGLYKKHFFSLKKTTGFEFMYADVIWAYENQPDQSEFEIHPNDVVLLGNGTKWAVISRKDTHAGATVLMRCMNRSKYKFYKKYQLRLLHGEAMKTGEATYNK